MEILGTRCDNLVFEEALEKASALLDGPSRSDIFFLNIDCLYRASEDEEYRALLNAAALVLPDGIGLKLAAGIFGQRLRGNCNGTDLCPELIGRAAGRGKSVFLLGGRDGVAERAAENLKKRFPALRIAGTHHGYFERGEAVIERINRSGADVLFVALGVPAQEKWIARNRRALAPRLCLGVGALLDFLSGRVRRAPGVMRALRLEWAWRLCLEPGRLGRRYLGDLKFLGALLGKKISGRA